MDEKLAGVLSRVALSLNPRARASFLRLLPGGSRPAVEALVRRDEGGQTRPLSPLEERLLDPLSPPPAEELPPEEGEEAAAGTAEEAEMALEGGGREPGLPVLLALLCAAAEPDLAAEFLVRLPVHLQGPVVLKLAGSSSLHITRGLGREEAELVEALRQSLEQPEQWGMAAAARLLRAIPEIPLLRQILTAADQLDHQTIAILQNHLFVFEDLLRLGDPDLQTLLLQVDNATLAKSLMVTDEQVRNRLRRNVSLRRQALLAEEEERYAHATLAEIEGAQMAVLNLVRRLYEQGRITAYFGSVAKGEPSPRMEDREGEEPGGDSPGQASHPEKRRRRQAGILIVALLLALTGIGWLATEISFRFRSSPSGTAPQSRTAGVKPGNSMRVLVQGEGGGGNGGERRLEIGGSMRTPGGVRAVLELPHFGIFELEELTEVERPEPEDGERKEGLFLRVGQVRTTIVEDGFSIRTPVVEVAGSPGAVFRTWVVLDASTLVEVESGQVEVISLTVPGRRWTLQTGDQGRFDSRGKGDIQTRQEEEAP